jgi:CSLREA domain-containing protein
MLTEVSHKVLLLVAVAWLCGVGCSDAGPTCGPGTKRSGDRCVPTAQAATCGPGSVLQGQVCVPAVETPADAGADAPGDAAIETQAGDDTAEVDVPAIDVPPDDAEDVPDAMADAGPVDAPDVTPDVPAACDPPCVASETCVDGTCAACQPACSLNKCGDDGCGGSCGTCPGGAVCLFGQCALVPTDASCVALCGGVAASGCSCQGDCAALGTCCVDFAQVCGCVGSCTGKVCGDDGCGGTCGACPAGSGCEAGACVDDPCQPDPCSGHGSCALPDGACTCDAKYSGPACAACAPGLVDYPACKLDLCSGAAKPCSGHGKCAPVDGSCACDTGFKGADCGQCVVAGGTWPACANPCLGVQCDDANPCTDDACNASGQCVHVANTIPCTDGNVCTSGDHCLAGTCIGQVKACDLAVNATGDGDDGSCTPSHCSLREAILLANSDPGATTIGFTGDLAIALIATLPKVTAPLTIDALGHTVVVDGRGKLGILQSSADLQLIGLQLQSGKAAQGAAVDASAGKLVATRVRFVSNSATQSGGAVRAVGSAIFDRCVFDNNLAQGKDPEHGGGAVFVQGPFDVSECTFAGNGAVSSGGAILASVGSSGKVRRSAAFGNNANTGGAIRSSGVIAVNSTFSGNFAADSGGAIYDDGQSKVVHCTFVGNTALASPEVGGNGAVVTNSLVVASAGDSGTSSLGAWGGSTPTVALAASATALDAADDAACADPDVQGIDQRGVARPQGDHCDLGAYERGADPCADLASTATCSDGDACTVGDTCAGGTCKPGASSGCDDGELCTSDLCTTWGGCSHGPSSAVCDDGNPCTAGDACAAGACQPETLTGCDDGNACTADACQLSTGCTHTAAAGACSDGDLCTQGDTCQTGACVAGGTVCTAPTVGGLAAHYSATVPGAVLADADGQVTAWKDLSGHGRDLLPSGSGPVLDKLGILGTPALDFAGGKGLVSNPFGLNAEVTVFLVVRIGKSAAWGSLAHHGNRDTDWAIENNGSKSSSVVHFQSANDNAGAELNLLAGNVYVLSARISGGKRTFTATQTTTVTTSADGTGIVPGDKALYVGKSDAGEASQAAIGELLYYDKALTDAERAQVVTYLRTAWNFALPKPDVLWLDAGQAKSLQLGDQGQVQTWLDQSGQGHDAASTGQDAPGSNGAQTPGGQASLLFTPASAVLQTTSLSTGPQMTVVAVVHVPQSQPLGVAFAQAGTVTLRQAAGSEAKLQWRIGTGDLGPTVPFLVNAWQIVTAVEDATTATLQVGTGEAAVVLVPGVTGSGALTIGNAAGGGAVLGGSLAEVRVFSTALSPLDRAAVAEDCRKRWGL